MKRRLTEERIIGPIKEHESGIETGDSCRRLPGDIASAPCPLKRAYLLSSNS